MGERTLLTTAREAVHSVTQLYTEDASPAAKLLRVKCVSSFGMK